MPQKPPALAKFGQTNCPAELYMLTSLSLLSLTYMVNANPSCFWLLRQLASVAFNLALAKTGSRIAARIAMIAITTNSSIKVNAPNRDVLALRRPVPLNFLFNVQIIRFVFLGRLLEIYPIR